VRSQSLRHRRMSIPKRTFGISCINSRILVEYRNIDDGLERNKSTRHQGAEKQLDPLHLALSLSWDRSVPTVASGLLLDHEAPIYNAKSAAKNIRHPLILVSLSHGPN